MKLLVVVATVALLFAITVYRKVRAACRAAPGRRPWLIVASLVVLGLVGAAVPGIADLRPPYSESPSGLFVIGGRLLVLGTLAVGALATGLAAALARPSSAPGDA